MVSDTITSQTTDLAMTLAYERPARFHAHMRIAVWLLAALVMAACAEDSICDCVPPDAETDPAPTDPGARPEETSPEDAPPPEDDPAGPEDAAANPDTPDAPATPDTAATSDPGAPADEGNPVDAAPPPPTCPDGVICVDTFPYFHTGDTSALPPGTFDAYACKPSVDESGPEQVYRVEIPKAGFLSAAVYDADGVDVDLHILSALDPDACLDRGHHDVRADVEAGSYWLVVDTWVDEDGAAQSGPYQLDIGFVAPSLGPCAMEEGIMKRVGDGGNHLKMPATGPVVLEAHLVTQEEPPPYPASSTEELSEHYSLSQSQTHFVLHRSQTWAPLEGASFYGGGIGSPTLFPVVDEGWYVCMYWTKESRPERGTKMIMRLPGTDRAVVVAAGYETGPGDLTNIAGTVEETHFYLGTSHHSTLTLGIATDQVLPFGPRTCTD